MTIIAGTDDRTYELDEKGKVLYMWRGEDVLDMWIGCECEIDWVCGLCREANPHKVPYIERQYDHLDDGFDEWERSMGMLNYWQARYGVDHSQDSC